MAGKEFVVDKAMCMCKYGAAPGKLMVTDNQFFRLNGTKLCASTMTLGNVIYPPGFGICKVNPMFPKPCVPAITQWNGQFSKITMMGGNPLTDKSKGTCSCGGPDCIEFMQTGQIPVPGSKQMQQATGEHQGELDAMGDPSALAKHSIDMKVSLLLKEENILVKTVKGEKESFVGQTLTYEVEHYNTPIVSDETRSRVKWKVTIGDKEETVDQPGTDVLELSVKEEWQGKELCVMAYIKKPSSNVCKKTNIAIENENIVVIGAQQHNSSLIKNVLRMDVGQNSKFMFVHQAIREVLTYRELKWVILLCEEGYSSEQISKIKETFDNIKNRQGGKTVKKIIPISGVSHIVQYINTGDINGGSDVRNKRKISKLVFYSHGVVKKILPWMGAWGLGEAFDVSSAERLKINAMGHDMITYSYACRTGLGNSDIDDSVYKDKQKTKCHDLLLDKSLAQVIANTTSRGVYAFLKRTWYGNTLFTSDEYDFLDACDAYKRRTQPKRNSLQYHHIVKGGLNDSEKKRYKRLREISQSFENVDGAIFCPSGAQHPVIAGKTPEGLLNSLKLFVPSKK